jgi:hypothetical protein
MGSLLLDLVRQALPHVPLNKGVLQANTDSLLDALPLITMAPCLAVSAEAQGRTGAAQVLEGAVARVTRPRARLWAGAAARRKLPLPLTAGPCMAALPLIAGLHALPHCPQTLQLHWRRGRYADFVLFFAGFALALIYHWLHMHPEVRFVLRAIRRVLLRSKLQQAARSSDQRSPQP